MPSLLPPLHSLFQFTPSVFNSRQMRRITAGVIAIAIGVGALSTASAAPSTARSAAARNGWKCMSFENGKFASRIAFAVTVTRDSNQKNKHAVVDVWAQSNGRHSPYANYTFTFKPLSTSSSVIAHPRYSEDGGDYGLVATTTFPRASRSRIVLATSGEWPERTMMRDRQSGFFVPGVLMANPSRAAVRRGTKPFAASEMSMRLILMSAGPNITSARLEAVWPDEFIYEKTWSDPPRRTSQWKLTSTGNALSESSPYPWCR